MKQEDHVTYKSAKIMKELGYADAISSYYDEDKKFEFCFVFTNTKEDKRIAAPTLYDAQCYLRDNYNIEVLPSMEFDEDESYYLGFGFDTYKGKELVDFTIGCETYKEALSKGIERALELVLKK